MYYQPIIASAVAGIGAVVISSIIAPWINWRRDQKKAKTAYRIELVKAGHKLVHDELMGKLKEELVDTDVYNRLRYYLKPEIRNLFETQEVMNGIVPVIKIEVVIGKKGIAAHPTLQKLSDDIHRLELDWKLT